MLAALLQTVLRPDDVDLVPAVEVTVSFLALKKDLPKEIASRLVRSSSGSWANLGNESPGKVADRLALGEFTDDVASPRVLVGLDGKTARLLSYLEDGDEKRGYGCEVKATPSRDAFELDVRLGDPGDDRLLNSTQFRLQGADTFLLCPKQTICGMKMVALVRGVRSP